MKKSKIQSRSKSSILIFRLQTSNKVPLPQMMYTKPVDVSHPHQFGSHKSAVNYDPLSWSDFFDRRELLNDKVPIYIAGNQGHVFICLHGAGHSAMSFAVMAKYLKMTSTVVSFDFRGHGDHFCENETDMSHETLVNDTLEVVKYVSSQFADRSIIMVGHSMGGSIATKATSKI